MFGAVLLPCRFWQMSDGITTTPLVIATRVKFALHVTWLEPYALKGSQSET